jgi:hypothetical protein
MRNVTVSIPDDVYRRARIWAAERDVSLSQVVAYVLDTLNGIRRAERHFGQRMEETQARIEPAASQPVQPQAVKTTASKPRKANMAQ